MLNLRPHPELNRLAELKQLKQLANKFLEFYKQRQKQNEKGWENDLSKRNISLLKATITKLNKLQHDSKIAEYLEAIKPSQALHADATEIEKHEALQKLSKNISVLFSQGINFSLLMEINKCSPRLSYFNDLTWFRHGTVLEHIEFGLGKVDASVFEQYLPYQIDNLNKTKDTLFARESYKDDLILLEAVIPLIEKDKFIPANILVITLIEGLVRKFAANVYSRQNSNLSNSEVEEFAYQRNSSFEKLIKSKEWKKDIPISFADFIIEYAHTESSLISDLEEKLHKHKEADEKIKKKLSEVKTILLQHIQNPISSDEEIKTIAINHMDEFKQHSTNLLSEEDRTVRFGIDIYLDFLVKEFKEDRNKIIHGKYSFFKEKWKTLFYLTALHTLIEKIVWYEDNIS